MTAKNWADLIREHYDELRDTVSEQMWSCYGRVQHDVFLWVDGSVDIRANVGGNDKHLAGACTIWTSFGMEYASPYDEWTEEDWIGAVRGVVGRDGMPAFWDRIVKDQDADDLKDYQEHARNGYYDQVSYILTHSAAFDDIMDEIANNWKNDTESDRIEAAEDVLDRLIKTIEAWENEG